MAWRLRESCKKRSMAVVKDEVGVVLSIALGYPGIHARQLSEARYFRTSPAAKKPNGAVMQTDEPNPAQLSPPDAGGAIQVASLVG